MSDLRRTTRWSVENTLSSAGFSVRNFGVRTVVGTVPVTHAWVDVDDDGRPVRVEADLDLAGIDTGDARRDHDLRQPRLLATARYPVLRFRGGPGRREAGGWTVPGVLSAHGREVALDLTVSGDAGGLVVTVAFDRADLGIRAPRLLVGRRIEVRIDAVLRPA